MTIGDRIKLRRKEIGLSVDQLAERIGKNRATVYRYESNEIEKFPLEILEPLASALCTTPANLMGWDENSADQWSVQFRYSLEEMLLSVDSTDAYEAGIDLQHLEAVVSGSSPLSLKDCCNICAETGYSLDEMVGLHENRATDNNGSPDEVSMKIAEIILRLSPSKKVEALHFLQYLESKPET